MELEVALQTPTAASGTDSGFSRRRCPPLSHDIHEILGRLRPETWSWNRKRYVNFPASDAHIYDSTIVFHPTFSFGTAAARADRKLGSRSVVYWEVVVPYVYGTSMMFGIGTAIAKLTSPVYFENLLGQDGESMGLSHKGFLYANHRSGQYCAPLEERDSARVGMLFHGPKRTLSYFINGKALGVAFHDIDTSKTYFPMVASTAQKSQFVLTNQFGDIVVNPESLSSICISKIVHSVHDVDKLAGILPECLLSQICEHVMLRENNHFKVDASEFGLSHEQAGAVCSSKVGTCADCGMPTHPRDEGEEEHADVPMDTHTV